ncbi:MAG: tRNA threonylcarbamoyladenosine dehydratase [Firmicutes bacterium]|nr:tRNA threonylcarbamoyladenosine dehydratase [Bacillota bacterium]
MDAGRPEAFERTALLLGNAALRQLAAARVAVVGLGGVGSYAAEALARCGIGHLVLVDGDVVVASNLNRQLVALHSTLGQPKVQVMAARVKDIHPGARVDAVFSRYGPHNRGLFEYGPFDYLVDAIDDVPAKVDLLAQAVWHGIPAVSSMGAGQRRDPTAWRVADISRTHTCPLARAVRVGLRQKGIERGIKAVFSVEPPARGGAGPQKNLGSGFAQSRRPPLGTVPFVTGTAGLLLASVVVQDLLAGGNDAGA